MANTFTVAAGLAPSTVMGNTRVVMGQLTMTDGNGGVDLGLNAVYNGSVTPLVVTTGGFGADWNTASGNVHIYSAASGDTFQVLAFGN